MDRFDCSPHQEKQLMKITYATTNHNFSIGGKAKLYYFTHHRWHKKSYSYLMPQCNYNSSYDCSYCRHRTSPQLNCGYLFRYLLMLAIIVLPLLWLYWCQRYFFFYLRMRRMKLQRRGNRINARSNSSRTHSSRSCHAVWRSLLWHWKLSRFMLSLWTDILMEYFGIFSFESEKNEEESWRLPKIWS